MGEFMTENRQKVDRMLVNYALKNEKSIKALQKWGKWVLLISPKQDTFSMGSMGSMGSNDNIKPVKQETQLLAGAIVAANLWDDKRPLIPGEGVFVDMRTLAIEQTRVIVTVNSDSPEVFKAATIEGITVTWDEAAIRKIKQSFLN